MLSMHNVHSMQALEAHLVDDTSDEWHRLHQEVKEVYSKGLTQLKNAVRKGIAYTLSHRLTYYASNFASTTPVGREVTVGFYDTPLSSDNTVFISWSLVLRFICSTMIFHLGNRRCPASLFWFKFNRKR
jgi:hypothetical protein